MSIKKIALLSTALWMSQNILAQTELPDSVYFKLKPAAQMAQTGKIYLYKNYLLIGEPNVGIHVIDNANPRKPKSIAVLDIRDNMDFAVKDNTLYATSGRDLLAINIQNVENARLIQRLPNVFNTFVSRPRPRREPIASKDNDMRLERERPMKAESAKMAPSAASAPMPRPAAASKESARAATKDASGSTTGTGGSMAALIVYKHYLYAIDANYSIKLFDISQQIQLLGDVPVRAGLETLFIQNDKMYIGSAMGMFIYDLADAKKPQYISAVQHVRSCDPVVVEGDWAYVTLHAGTGCNSMNVNQLEVIDIRDLKNPQRVKIMQMVHPKGLSINGDNLYICDDGLKIMDISDKKTHNIVLLNHLQGFDAFDIIAYEHETEGEIIMVIGKNGLYQISVKSPASKMSKHTEILSLIATVTPKK
jgi:hypothetical protein